MNVKVIENYRPFQVFRIIANFQGDRKLYYEIKVKKGQFSVANFWRLFEINGIE